ncbi:hypothetical protein EI94DRAFT_1741997 [Lactarius quietus]|nr:hypothetical protein EI94DRAFT_1741997 [Lactarius quietus]
MLGLEILDSHPAIYAKMRIKEPHVHRVVTMQEHPELADRCACNNLELKHRCISPITQFVIQRCGTSSRTQWRLTHNNTVPRFPSPHLDASTAVQFKDPLYSKERHGATAAVAPRYPRCVLAYSKHDGRLRTGATHSSCGHRYQHPLGEA